MNPKVEYGDTFFSTVDPKRVFRLADECLLEIRLVESRKEAVIWKYEYEVKGEFGRIQKLLGRLKQIEIGE